MDIKVTEEAAETLYYLYYTNICSWTSLIFESHMAVFDPICQAAKCISDLLISYKSQLCLLYFHSIYSVLIAVDDPTWIR